MGCTVKIEKKIKKRVKTFIKPDGVKINGGAEEYYGNNLGGRRSMPEFK